MDYQDCTTETRQKGKHLSYEERVIIQTRIKDGFSIPKIAKELGCAPNTVRNEIKRGTVTLYNGNIKRYKAKEGQKKYEMNRQNSVRHYDYLEKKAFIDYVIRNFRERKWSYDASVGHALRKGLFSGNDMVCTKTLYNYTDLELINIKNYELPEKMRRRPKHSRVRENKRVLGKSIEDRPKEIEKRDEFGHWEIDLVIGSKTKDDSVLLTMTERMSRYLMMTVVEDKCPQNVMKALHKVMSEYSEHSNTVFKSITTDNGSEFASLHELEAYTGTEVYFTHPYTSCEKGSVERNNRIIRRFIKKGKKINDYHPEDVIEVELWANRLPRKILGYSSADAIFEAELDRIYRLEAA